MAKMVSASEGVGRNLWEYNYLVVKADEDGRYKCLVCHTLLKAKKYNVSKHYNLKHSSSHYKIVADERRELVEQLKSQLHSNQEEKQVDVTWEPEEDQLREVFLPAQTVFDSNPVCYQSTHNHKEGSTSSASSKKRRSQGTMPSTEFKKKISSTDRDNTLLNCAILKLNDVASRAAQLTSTREDSYDYFGKYVGSMLRAIGPPNALLLQQKVTAMITNSMLSTTSTTVLEGGKRTLSTHSSLAN